MLKKKLDKNKFAILLGAIITVYFLTLIFVSHAQVPAVNSGTAVYPTSGHIMTGENNLSELSNGNLVTARSNLGIAVNYYEAWLTSGTSWTSPSWVDASTTFTVYGCAGGGGGAGDTSSSNLGVGGAAGAMFIYGASNAITASTTYTYAIGAAGSGGSAGANNGSAGGNTTLTVGGTTFTANGGNGGPYDSTVFYSLSGSPTATNGTVNVAGQSGWAGFTSSGSISVGGSSMFGAGGASITGAGVAGGKCAGGSGGLAGSVAGGNGGAGLIHIIVSGS
jgi:hypothetical protein